MKAIAEMMVRRILGHHMAPVGKVGMSARKPLLLAGGPPVPVHRISQSLQQSWTHSAGQLQRVLSPSAWTATVLALTSRSLIFSRPSGG
jgi:hypothetical protein